MKLLVDECLSPELAKIARGEGHSEASHIVWLGLAGRKDWANHVGRVGMDVNG